MRKPRGSSKTLHGSCDSTPDTSGWEDLRKIAVEELKTLELKSSDLKLAIAVFTQNIEQKTAFPRGALSTHN